MMYRETLVGRRIQMQPVLFRGKDSGAKGTVVPWEFPPGTYNEHPEVIAVKFDDFDRPVAVHLKGVRTISSDTV